MTLAWIAALGVAAPLLALLALALVVARRRARELERLLEHAHLRLERIQRAFGRFTPDDVIERLTESGDEFTPHRRAVTVLFADLRGFTALCDGLDPAQTVTLLNGYFECMTEAIAAHHGRVTELIGDGLLALFGALEPNPWQARDAVLAALDMRAALARYNGQLRAQSLPELRFGIGIHCGEVLAGVMGNEGLSKFGVVGDPINVASRVEGLTKVHGVDLLITDEVRAALEPSFRLRPMPAIAVKGKPEPIVTYWVEGLAHAAVARA
ncbi:MAG: adenylate/guanylate cyclase domain-containing protein [Candidatus Lambdaproteobacteria bacterium]|nr:adenylate/guanylate cyclase domain-containing protein [Candidatus Lambdaproteobacteria bacterium]